MFSGRWEDCLDHDSNGKVFLDFDPYCFQQILTMLRCRPFDLASSAAPAEAIITPDKFHAYKCLVDYLGLEGVCGAADKSSNLPSDVCQLTYVSDDAVVTQSMAKGRWVPCVTSMKCCYAVANAGPHIIAGQAYYIKLENSRNYRFVGIAKETPASGYDVSKSAFGWSPSTVWVAGAAKHSSVCGRFCSLILQVDMNTSCLAYVDLDCIDASNGKPQGWMMLLPGLMEIAQQLYSFQMMLDPDSRSKVLPVTDTDKELFTDKSTFILV